MIPFENRFYSAAHIKYNVYIYIYIYLLIWRKTICYFKKTIRSEFSCSYKMNFQEVIKLRLGCFKRTALKHVYYLGWNRSLAQVGCMRQALRPGALGKPRGSRWRGRWEGGSGWGTHVNPWLFHFNLWQNPPQIKINK